MKTKRSNIIIRASKIQFFFVLSLLGILSSCNSTKFIADDEALVRETTIKFDEKNDNEISNLEYELEQLIQQPAPGKFVVVHRDYYDLKNQNLADTNWYKKFIKRFIAEEHTIFDTARVAMSANEMQRYLQNKKGFYDAEVTSEYKVKSQQAKTKFTVSLGKQFRVDEVHYRSNNPEIQSILNEIKEDALIESGTAIDASTFDTEKERIFQALQNRGYANFLSNNITIKGDSSDVSKRVNILFDLNATEESRTFVKYEIGKINVFTDYRQDGNYPKVPSKVINGKNYYSLSKNFVVKPRAIDKQIFVKTGREYNRSQYYQTIKKLSELSTYKFVKLAPSFDNLNDTLINYDIYLTPHQTKYISDFGTGSFFSTNSIRSQRLIGFSADGSLINRNAFGGSEKNESIVEVGLEFQILPQNQSGILARNSINLGASNVTTVPRQIDYLGLIGLIYSVADVPTVKQEQYEVATNTNFTGAWNYQEVINLYKITNFAAGVSYNYEPNNNWNIVFNPTGLNVLDYRYEPGSVWDSLLQESPLLENSFKSTILSGIIFKEITATYIKPENTKGFSWVMYSGFELSGGEVHLANQLYNSLSKKDVTFQVNDELQFAKFGKLQLDFRYNKKLNEYSSLAGRVNFGIARPYGKNNAVPYIKQFFVGGQNSMRAWQARELGPGGYLDQNPIVGQRFYQTGDMKFETNIEYRADFIGIFEYALFVDAGNVWTLEEDISRPNAKFSNLYKQLAVGWGWGLRLDWTYFILRFDFAYRLKNPYLLKESTPLATYYESPVGQGLLGFFGVPQIGINYPF